MADRSSSGSTEVVMPVSDLHGRTVWTETGDRVGTVKGVKTDDDGRIVALDVRERWMLGPHHEVPASEMRIDGGDVIVPASAMEHATRHEGKRRHDDRHDDRSDDGHRAEHEDVTAVAPAASTGAATAPAPVFLAGRDGAKGRFGGLDLIGSLFGALVTFASLLIIGGLLGAIFGASAPNIDTSLNSMEGLLTESLVIGAVTLFVASFLGGWCAGRSARFDGVGNGLMTVVWVLAIVALLGALATWLGDEYDVLAGANLPTFTTDEFQLWGIVAFAAAVVLMLLGAALGGALGESWHRRADRAMLEPVSVNDGATSATGQVGSPVAARPVDDRDAVHDDADRRPMH